MFFRKEIKLLPPELQRRRCGLQRVEVPLHVLGVFLQPQWEEVPEQAAAGAVPGQLHGAGHLRLPYGEDADEQNEQEQAEDALRLLQPSQSKTERPSCFPSLLCSCQRSLGERANAALQNWSVNWSCVRTALLLGVGQVLVPGGWCCAGELCHCSDFCRGGQGRDCHLPQFPAQERH